MIRDKVLLSRLAFPHPFVFQACSFNRENLWCPDRRFTACLLREVKPYRPRIAHVDRVGGATDDEQQSAWTLVVRVERLPIRGSGSNAAVQKTGAWRRPVRAPDPRRPCGIDVATGQRSGHQPLRATWARPVTCRDACRRKKPLPSDQRSGRPVGAVPGLVLEPGRDNFRDNLGDNRVRVSDVVYT